LCYVLIVFNLYSAAVLTVDERNPIICNY